MTRAQIAEAERLSHELAKLGARRADALGDSGGSARPTERKRQRYFLGQRVVDWWAILVISSVCAFFLLGC